MAMPRLSAEGLREEAPWGCMRAGVSPSFWGEGCAAPQIFLIFRRKMACFDVLSVLKSMGL